VEEEAAEELVDRQSQEPLLVGMCGVTPPECDVALLKSNQPAVRDGNAMRVPTEIAQRVLRAAERGLSVDNPVVTEEQTKPCSEGARFRKWRKVAIET
jgi:hypothetical protein